MYRALLMLAYRNHRGKARSQLELHSFSYSTRVPYRVRRPGPRSTTYRSTSVFVRRVRRYSTRWRPKTTATVNTRRLLGRILPEGIHARRNLPNIDASADWPVRPPQSSKRPPDRPRSILKVTKYYKALFARKTTDPDAEEEMLATLGRKQSPPHKGPGTVRPPQSLPLSPALRGLAGARRRWGPSGNTVTPPLPWGCEGKRR